MNPPDKVSFPLWIQTNKQTCLYAGLCMTLLACMFCSETYWSTMLCLYDLAPYTPPNESIFYSGPHFADMHGRLAAMEAHQAGYPVSMSLEPNPLDPFRRANIKPGYTLVLGNLGIDRNWLLPLSILTISAFTLLHALILRPTKLIHWIVGLLFFISPPIALGLDRANDDVVLFCMLVPICFLLRNVDSWKPIILVALWLSLISPAKYYPICGAVLLILSPNHLKARWLSFGFVATLLSCYAIIHYDEILFIKEFGPKPNSFYTFGGSLLGLYAGLPQNLSKLLPWTVLLLLTGAYGIFAIRKAKTEECSNDREISLNEQFFILGAGIHFFCYWLNSNYDYRLIFLALALPYLLELIDTRSSRRLYSIIALSIAFITFWMETITLWLRYKGDWKSIRFDDLFSFWLTQEILTFSFTLILAWFFIDIVYRNLTNSVRTLKLT